MSLKDMIEGFEIKPPIITLVGFPGTGKTSLAGLFPSPVFIQAEKSTTVFEDWPAEKRPTFLKRLPSPSKQNGVKTSDALTNLIRLLATENHEFKTLVIDTTTMLNNLFEQEVVEFDKPTNGSKTESIGNAAGGFHKGYDISMAMHGSLISKCEYLRENKNMTIVFLAHTGMDKVKNSPDQKDEYNVYSVAMHERSRKLYVAKSNAVIYMVKPMLTTGGSTDKRGNQTKAARVIGSDERLLLTRSNGRMGYVDAKTQFDAMPTEIEFKKNENPLLEYIPYFNQ